MINGLYKKTMVHLVAGIVIVSNENKSGSTIFFNLVGDSLNK